MKMFKYKGHKNPSSQNQFVPCGETGITKLIDIFHNFSTQA